MKYGYYPGCSLEKNAYAYHQSAQAVAQAFDIEFVEVEDWNCCGATEYFSVDALPAYALVSRNLAIAAKQQNSNQLVAPCSACFLNLKKTDHYMVESNELAEKVNTALEAGGFNYEPGSVKVRHLLDIVYNDVGIETLQEKVKRPLYQLKVAPYYGCLIPRPANTGSFDAAEYPTTLDELMTAIDATVVEFPLKAACCGGHMTQISDELSNELIRRLLQNAAEYQADVIACFCPNAEPMANCLP